MDPVPDDAQQRAMEHSFGAEYPKEFFNTTNDIIFARWMRSREQVQAQRDARWRNKPRLPQAYCGKCKTFMAKILDPCRCCDYPRRPPHLQQKLCDLDSASDKENLETNAPDTASAVSEPTSACSADDAARPRGVGGLESVKRPSQQAPAFAFPAEVLENLKRLRSTVFELP